jgi:hypothetical protein
MPEKSAMHQKKVDEAVQILNTTTGVNVPQAMILARFPKKDTTNEIVCRMIHRHLGALEAKQMTPCRDAPTVKEVQIVTNNDADLSPLTGKDNDPTASATMTTMTMGPTHPKPKWKHILVCDIADDRTATAMATTTSGSGNNSDNVNDGSGIDGGGRGGSS